MAVCAGTTRAKRKKAIADALRLEAWAASGVDIGCKYPLCVGDNPSEDTLHRGCKGHKPDKPLSIVVGRKRSDDGKPVPIYEQFERCPRALVPAWVMVLIDSARDHIAGAFFEPSAKFFEVIRIVKEWDKQRLQ